MTEMVVTVMLPKAKAADLSQAGMVTEAAWADIDGDKIKDLIIVGDWEAPKIYKNSGESLQKELQAIWIPSMELGIPSELPILTMINCT